MSQSPKEHVRKLSKHGKDAAANTLSRSGCVLHYFSCLYLRFPPLGSGFWLYFSLGPRPKKASADFAILALKLMENAHFCPPFWAPFLSLFGLLLGALLGRSWDPKMDPKMAPPTASQTHMNVIFCREN